jgi:hypothetical protein
MGTTTLRVDTDEYTALPFPHHNIQRVPATAGVTPMGAISREDFNHILGMLPLCKAPGPYGVPYELLKSAPEQLK